MYLSSGRPSASVTHCVGLANALCSAGHRVTLYVLTSRETLRGLPCAPGVHRVALELGGSEDTTDLSQEARFVRFAAQLRQRLPRHHVHHAHDWAAARALAQARGSLSGSLVRTVHQLTGGERALDRREAESLRSCDLVLTVSDELRRSLNARYGVHSERVDNGVDFARFAKPPVRDVVALGSRLGLSSAGSLLFTYGGISRRKNTLQVLEVFLRVLRRSASAMWVIIGDDEAGADEQAYRAEFDARVEAAGPWVKQAITRAGTLDDAELVSSYQVADAVVCASTTTGFGLCALEALAGGAPLVAARRGPFMEYLDRDCADLVDVDDLAEFERVLTRVLLRARSDDRRISAGMERARRHTWPRVAAQHVRAYGDLLFPDASVPSAWSGAAARETTGVIFKPGQPQRRLGSR